jgi:hypothetical protein
MKIKDIIANVDKSRKFKDDVCLYTLAEDEFNIQIDNYDYNQDKIVSYYFGSWYCTDQYVGYKVYFMDDVAVAVSKQTARRADEIFEWVSKEAYYKVRDHLLSLMSEPEHHFTICDIEQELGDGYTINFNSQLLDYHRKIANLNGELVNISERHRGSGFNEQNQYQPSLVRVYHQDGREEWVEVGKLTFPFNVNEINK